MKNFYYEKCHKPIHYKDLPINRRKVSIHYYYKIRKRWRNTIEKSIVTYKHIPQVITACQTEFVLDITHPHDTTYGGQDRNKTIKCIPNASLAQMDTLVETYSKRNPSYQFDYDPKQAHITFYGRNHKCLGRFRSKQILYPCQKFGSSRYSQFRRFKFATINRTHKKTPSGLPF